MANPQVPGSSDFFTWLKDQQWLFMIMGWFIVYLLNGNIQKKTKKQNLEVETALEVLERLRLLSEGMDKLFLAAKSANEQISGIGGIKSISIKRRILKLTKIESQLEDVYKAFFSLQNYYLTRVIVLSKCNKELRNISIQCADTTLLFHKYILELKTIKSLEIDDLSITKVEALIQKFHEANKLYSTYFISSKDLSVKLQNIYLSPILGNKIKKKASKSPIHKRLFSKITDILKRESKSREV